MRATQTVDYYNLLQIPRTADEEAIRRAYRTMATRIHPDNPDTGDVECFLQLQQAIRVLADPASRAKYDAVLTIEDHPVPVFDLKNFEVGVDGEMKRRLTLLALLYHRRRVEDERPGMTVFELERRLAFHREDLNFTLWYLTSKNYIKREMNGSEYTLLALGADYLEAYYQSTKTSSAAH